MLKKAKAILIATNQKAHFGDIIKHPETGKLLIFQHQNSTEYKQTIIIIIEEQPKDGEYSIDCNNNLHRFRDLSFIGIGTAILPTVIGTNDDSLGVAKISEGFQRKWIEKYNENCPIENVMVEYEVDKNDERNWYMDCPSGKYWEDKPIPPSKDRLYTSAKYLKPKFDSHNTITIKPVKDSYTLEEVKTIARKAWSMGAGLNEDEGDYPIGFKFWFGQQNF